MPSVTVVLHNIRSTHNVGSIFRSAEGFGVNRIILSGYTPYPEMIDDPRLPHEYAKITSQIHKTALGAEQLVPFERYESLEEWLKTFPSPILALEQSPKSVLIQDYSPPPEFALLLGEEVDGIDKTLLDRCDAIIEIPMSGHKESFNVSVAAGIALYALTLER